MSKPRPVAPIRTATFEGRPVVLLQVDFRDKVAIIADIAGYTYTPGSADSARAVLRGTHAPQTVAIDKISNIRDGLTVGDARANQDALVKANSRAYVKTIRVR